MGEAKVHILEGRLGGADSPNLFACGLKAFGITLCVGRTLILAGKCHEKVTCRRCRKAWPYLLDKKAAQTKDGAGKDPNG